MIIDLCKNTQGCPSGDSMVGVGVPWNDTPGGRWGEVEEAPGVVGYPTAPG